MTSEQERFNKVLKVFENKTSLIKNKPQIQQPLGLKNSKDLRESIIGKLCQSLAQVGSIVLDTKHKLTKTEDFHILFHFNGNNHSIEKLLKAMVNKPYNNIKFEKVKVYKIKSRKDVWQLSVSLSFKRRLATPRLGL